MMTYYNNYVPLVRLKTINMPRQARKTSGTGVYYVMLRCINRQDIFEDDEDYMKFLQSLHQQVECYDDCGPSNGHQLRDYSKSSNRSENRPLIYLFMDIGVTYYTGHNLGNYINNVSDSFFGTNKGVVYDFK